MSMKQHTGRKIAILCIFACFLILFFVLMAVRLQLAAAQTGQFRNKVWQGDETVYSQVSCYLSEDAGLSADSITELRRGLGLELETASLKPANDSARLWIDAYSTETTLTAENGGNSVKVSATAVGGEFFFFHPIPLLSGYYFSEEELMHDRVVIDENLAWQFFGSSDVAGQRITIGGKPFLVAAVTQPEDNALFAASYGKKPHLYLSYSARAEMLPECKITCYEAILPSPVTGFGKELVAKGLSNAGFSAEAVENSARFSIPNLWERLKSIGNRSMRLDTIQYPYWENIAVVIQDRCALLLFGELAALALSLIALVIAFLIFKQDLKALGGKLVPKHFKR